MLVGLLVAVLGPFGATGAQADAFVPIAGAGSTWSQSALDHWRRDLATDPGMTVNYIGSGSADGRREFIDGWVDFAISELPFQTDPQDGTAPEVPSRSYTDIPIVAGGTAFMYNLTINGRRVTDLRLSGETITKIFTGVITRWSDPAVAADNPDLAMPDTPIVPVVRRDTSGTSLQLTRWMATSYPSLWQDFCARTGLTSPCGPVASYPVYGSAKAQAGSDGVTGYVAQSYGAGAITYVENSYARTTGFPVAKVLNAAGYYVEPTAQAVAVALLKARISTGSSPADYRTQILDDVYTDLDPRAYPLSGYDYLIVPTEVTGSFTTAQGHTVGAFASYALCQGQQQADSLGNAPLPINLVQAASEQIARIPGASTTGIDLTACTNPTFAPGDSVTNNRLLLTAPYPPDCDRQGVTQCTAAIPGPGAGTTTTLDARSAPTSPRDVVLTATVTVSGGGGAALGWVVFRDGGTVLAQVPLAQRSATVTISSLGAGPHALTAEFGSAAGFASSRSEPVAWGVPESVDPQVVQVTVPTGALTLTSPYTPDHPLDLGDAVLDPASSTYSASAPFAYLTITDTRAGNLGFTVSAVADPFRNASGGAFDASHAGLTQVTAIQVPGNALSASSVAVTDHPPAVDGLAHPVTIATLPAGEAIGSVRLAAAFDIAGVPSSVGAGAFTSVVTFTAL